MSLFLSRAPVTALPCLLGRCIPRSMTAIQNLELDKDFDAEGIEIPFPQRTVWIHSADEDEASDTD